MNEDIHDKEIAELVVKTMDRQVAGQDAATRARLAAMRRAALAQRSGWQPFFWLDRFRSWGVGGAALATAMSFSALLFIDAPVQESSSGGDPSIELAVLSGDAELYADMDFYYWLEQQEESREL